MTNAKKYTYGILLALLPVFVQARSVLSFTIDGGYSATQYTLSEGKLLGGVGYGGDLGYVWFFHQNVGIGLGAGFRHYAGGALINGTIHYPNVIDTDKEPYEHLTYYANWQEKQDLYYVEFPLSLQFYVPLEKVHLWMAIGANYSLAVAGRTAAQGDLTHRGFYQKWGLTLDIPDHGFYETSEFKPTSMLKPQSTVAAFASFDVGIPLTESIDFILGVKAHYAFLSAYKLDGSTSLGYRNDKEGWASVHYFMADYSSLMNTTIVSGKAFPWSVDLEIGIKYSFGNGSQKRCKACKHLDDQWRPIRYRHHCVLCE